MRQASIAPLIRPIVLAEWRHHPWRQAVALLSIALGVALAFSVHLINASALAEFGQAVRSVNGQPDFELRGAGSLGIDESAFAAVVANPHVDVASPVAEIDTFALDAQGERQPLRIVGIDPLIAPAIAPALLPRPTAGDDRPSLLDPDAAFLHPAAQRAFGGRPTLNAQSGSTTVGLRIAGNVAADGPALAVVDIAGAQEHFGMLGRLSRIDVRAVPGADRDALQRELTAGLGLRAASPDEATQRVSNLSRAYRVNLTVLALVALFTGAFLVFSILSLSVAKRVPQIALLGVLGLPASGRRALVLVDAALVGVLGSACGIALGTALAVAGLRLLGGDLGSGMLGGEAPALRFSVAAALTYGSLGVVAALAGAWVPARVAQRMAPAYSLKGLGGDGSSRVAAWPALLLLGGGAALCLAPPIAGLPLGAYVGVALLLLGGIAAVPLSVQWLLRGVRIRRHAVAMLAVERARDQRHAATVAVAGVVAALSLAVALTVMVTSFRNSVLEWLDQVLLADVYARTAVTTSTADAAFLEPGFARKVALLRGVLRVQPMRVAALRMDPDRPTVSLLARSLRGSSDEDEPALPMVGRLVPAEHGLVSVYASEAFASLYRVRPGDHIALPLPDGRQARVLVRGLWRDYARVQGALAIDRADWIALSGDERINDLAIWLAPGADPAAVETGVRSLAGNPALVELSTPAEIRATSLRIFDRSFAVTYWLQAVAIAIGLFGVAASYSAQTLARSKEFGTLQHLGFTRRQMLALVAGEGLAWTGAGAVLGIALGLAVSVVLVHVVNPQSFHWTMQLSIPWGRLLLLGAAVLAAGACAAWLAGRAAASGNMALAVKEDW